jgi:hypothetical protein
MQQLKTFRKRDFDGEKQTLKRKPKKIIIVKNSSI